MVDVTLQKVSATKGDPIPVRIVLSKGTEYRQIQIEVFDVAVRNPTPKLGFGTTPKQIGTDTFEVIIDSKHLELGLYEIRLVRFHDTENPEVPAQLDFLPTRDHERKIFEIIPAIQHPRTVAEILTDVERRESELEQMFLAPVDARSVKDGPADEYCVFVFIKNLLLGTRIRFEQFEVVPTGSGLDAKDHLDFVNDFLRTRTSTNISFNYEEKLRDQMRQANPVCVAHFPTITASSCDEARDHCVVKTNLLLLAFSLSRDAGGVIFDVVVSNRKTSEAVKYAIANPYVGNLLTGHLSGEHPDSLEAYLGGLRSNPMNQFLTGLFKEARRESSADFQYVRYWQILETLAESRNYDSDTPLVDYAGGTMTDGRQNRFTKGSVNIVFNLLRESGIGSTNQTWKNVNIWFAFRNAVAHHGSVSRFTELSRDNVRNWARIGYEEIQRAAGHDMFLWSLKEDVKLLLMRELVASQHRDCFAAALSIRSSGPPPAADELKC